MPYLHWETHRKQTKMANVIRRNLLQKDQEKRSYAGRDLKIDFVKLAEAIVAKHRQAIEGPRASVKRNRKQKDQEERFRPWKATPLGEYLLNATQLYNALDIEPDLRVVADYLFHNPPLHPRRTLYQSVHYSRVDIPSRDENQVVFRESIGGTGLFGTLRLLMVDQLWLYILDES